jgi:hypothetical protein
MLPEFPIAEEAIKSVWNKRLFKALGFSDPIVSQIPLRVQREGNKAAIGTNEIELHPISAECKWKLEIGQGIPLDDYFALADQMGSDLARQQALGTLKALTEKPGPHHTLFKTPKDERISFEEFVSKIEGMEIDFDAQGLPNWPQIFLSENACEQFYKDFKAHENDESRLKRIELMVAKKRKEFDEREARRRLVD